MTTYAPERTNGHRETHGRAVPELPEITFPGSGRKAHIRKVGNTTKTAIQKAVRKEMEAEGKPEPRPPILKVHEVYDDPASDTVEEPNPDDPKYLKAYKEWKADFDKRCAERLLKYITDNCLIYAVDTELVAQLRCEWDAQGLEVEGDDQEIFIQEILMPTEEDYIYLMACATQASVPSEADVTEMVRRFRGRL